MPKGQIFVRDRTEPYWFATVRETIAFTLLPEMPKGIVAIYVRDMARSTNQDQPEVWVLAKQAWFVIGSRQRSGMDTPEAMPFSEEAAAQRFAADNGGRLVRLADTPQFLHFGRRGVMRPAARRRLITISTANAGLTLLSPRARQAETPLLHVWRGTALGADAMLLLHHPAPAAAEALIQGSLAEVARLERQLSLYDPESALVRLNREGALDYPPLDLLRAMNESARFHALTGGLWAVPSSRYGPIFIHLSPSSRAGLLP